MSQDRKDRVRAYYLRNGSVIYIMSAHGQFRQTRGPTIDMLYVDEAQSIEIEHLPVAQSTMMTSKYRKTIVAGTGSLDGDSWHRKWRSSTMQTWNPDTCAWQPNHEESTIAGYHLRWEMSPYYTAQLDRQLRDEFGPFRYQTEIAGEFATGHQVPLPHSVAIECYHKSEMVLPSQRPESEIYASMDLAIGGAAFTILTISTYDEPNDTVQVLATHKFDEGKSDILFKQVDQIIQDWRPDHIISDAGGNPALTERMTAKYDIHRYHSNATAKAPITYKDGAEAQTISKSHMMQRCISRFERRCISIPHCNDTIPWTIEQLISETAEIVEPKGAAAYPRYDKQHGRQDDFLQSLMFLEAYLYTKSDPANPRNRPAHFSFGDMMPKSDV